eukprot:12678325-Alexandrium_andersonii.AAC.1
MARPVGDRSGNVQPVGCRVPREAFVHLPAFPLAHWTVACRRPGPRSGSGVFEAMGFWRRAELP